MKKVSVSVPASVANLGPGFDCLALALDLHNTIEVDVRGDNFDILIEGEGADQLPRDHRNLCLRAVSRRFELAGKSIPNMIMRLHNRIPLSSGLGSSSAAIIGGILVANALLGDVMEPIRILELASEFEDHLDNATACLLGGFIAVVREGDEVMTQQFPIPDLTLVIILPEIDISTIQMRQILPKKIAFEDAVHNLGYLVLTLDAIRSGNIEGLSKVMKDKLHQPYRTPLIPGYHDAEMAAFASGAAAVCLSGAGPAMVAFTKDNHNAIAQAMCDAYRNVGVEAKQFILPVSHSGASFSHA
jgi:homoserine kinase